MPAGGLKQIGWGTDYVWTTGGATWTKTIKFLMDGLEPGTTEPVTVEMGDGNQEQDGLRLTGSFAITSTTVPAAGTRYWIYMESVSGVSTVVGGLSGCRVTSAKSNLRPLGGGPQVTKVTYSCTGAQTSDVIETSQN